MRRVDSFNVVVAAGVGFLLLFGLVVIEVCEADFAAVITSKGSIESSKSAPARFIMRCSDLVVSLSKERPNRKVSDVPTL